MKVSLTPFFACFVAVLFVLPATAEERAIDNDKPRDCSSLTDAAKKTRCEAFNKALAACQKEGKKVGKELNECLMQKGKAPAA